MATLLIEGPGAEDLVESRFRAKTGRPLASYPRERLVFGYFTLAAPGTTAAMVEEVVVRRHSTESVELHCHGGWAAVSLIEQALVAAGARGVAWPDWARAHHADPITAAARLALAAARTERTARILLDQYRGALRRAIEAVCHALARRDPQAAIRMLDDLLARARIGLHLVEPWQVVLAGPPNVGKSSLINALLGYSRAIVHPTPGTTRDVVTAFTALDGWPAELSDTAGLRAGVEVIEQAGVALAQRRLAEADLVLLVFDQSQPWSEAEARLVARRPGALVVHSKADLPLPTGSSRPVGCVTSALTGQGMETLVWAIVQRLVPAAPAAGAAVPFAIEQVQDLQAAAEAVRSGNLASAEALLSEKNGRFGPIGLESMESRLDSPCQE